MTDITLTAVAGRDAGKRFRFPELDPLFLAGLALRLVSALKIPSFDALRQLAAPADPDAPADEPDEDKLDTLLSILRGCDPVAVHALATEILGYVEIAPDPKHPEAWRPVMVGNGGDIQELKTLGAVVMTFASARLSIGG
jgi:hypothetical protein